MGDTRAVWTSFAIWCGIEERSHLTWCNVFFRPVMLATVDELGVGASFILASSVRCKRYTMDSLLRHDAYNSVDSHATQE
ncbi:hypothetical protein [Nostoc sp. NMS8]|uniref:hypothetical protein n=1 Tax=Nostoc sp. NMS8 TaxID=2815392 RepID=UPI0025E1AC90|nr:hypothetical protein [Nostoc sp. NMS8]MBN3957664.1 hypothetical protein [Nostoc sp. NMS8]